MKILFGKFHFSWLTTLAVYVYMNNSCNLIFMAHTNSKNYLRKTIYGSIMVYVTDELIETSKQRTSWDQHSLSLRERFLSSEVKITLKV